MHTMHPVVVMGSYRWDQELLPLDEFEERLRALRACMGAHGWQGLVVHADAQDSALVTWLTNFYPRLRWAVALIGPAGQPELLVAGATRDLPAAATLTWCRSVESWGEAARRVSDWHARCGGGNVGVHGLAQMRSSVRRTLLQALAPATAADAGPAIEPLLAHKRWRELTVLREAHRTLASTLAVLCEQWADSGSVRRAVLAAERHARLAQAQDVRILFSLDGGRSLQPFETMAEDNCETLVAFVAVRYLGYWAQAWTTQGGDHGAPLAAVRERLRALRGAAAPGADGAALARAAESVPSGGLAPHPVTGTLLGHASGLRLTEAPFFTAAGAGAMQEGGVYLLQSGLTAADGTGAVLSCTVCIVDGRVEDLHFPALPAAAC